MEIIQSDDILREEIINDAKIKAERLLKKADNDIEENNKKLEEELKRVKDQMEKEMQKSGQEAANLIKASVDIEIKKEIFSLTGKYIEKFYDKVKKEVIENKLFTYKEIILKLIKKTADKICSDEYSIVVSKNEKQFFKEDDFLKIKPHKGKISKAEFTDPKEGIMLYDKTGKKGAFISLNKYVEILKEKTRNKIYEIVIKGK